MLTPHTRLFLFLVLFLSGTNTSGQYLSTLNDGQTWAVSGYYIQFDFRNMYDIYVDGEEVYEGQEYKVLKIYSDLFWERTFGLVREDTVSGKVWFRSHLHADFNEYIDTSDEVILADYSLEPGDQFYYTYFREYWDDEFFIDSLLYEVEEVGIVDGRKYIQTNSLTVLDEEQNGLWSNPFYNPDFQYPVANQVPLRFIEGIGPSFSLIAQNFESVVEQYPLDPYLLCAYIDDVEIWNDPFVEECFYEGELPLTTNINEDGNQNKFIAFPNPATDILKLGVSVGHAVDFQLFDMAGKLWMTKSVNSSVAKIHVDHLPKGVYLLRVRSEQYSDSKLILKM